MDGAKLASMIRRYGRRLLAAWSGAWRSLRRAVARQARRTPVQKSLFGLTAAALLLAAVLGSGWNPFAAWRADLGAPEPARPSSESAVDIPEPMLVTPPQRVEAESGEPVAEQPVNVGIELPVAADPAAEKNGDIVPRPVAASVTAGADALPVVSVAEMVWPVTGTIVRPFGWYRHPVFGDWKYEASTALEPEGDERTVRAALAGRVKDVINQGGLWQVSIEHAGGLETVYEGMTEIAVHSYAVVETGQAIGTAPAPGTGRTLTFAVRSGGEAVDPEQWLGSPSLMVSAP